MAGDVLVVGDALLDVHVMPATPMRRAADVPATIRVEPGGQGANMAVRLARLGVNVRLRCALGSDAAGALVRDALEGEGVSLDIAVAAATGTVVVLGEGAGERTMLSDRATLAQAWTPPSRDAAWLVVSGYALPELAAELSGVGERRAVIGLGFETEPVADWRAALDAFAPSLVVLNEREATLVAGSSDPVATMARRTGAVVVMTGPAGASAALGGSMVTTTTQPVAPVDTTGAGDAFAATLIAHLLEVAWPPPRRVLEEALGAAARLATAVTTVRGAQGRIPGEPRAAQP